MSYHRTRPQKEAPRGALLWLCRVVSDNLPWHPAGKEFGWSKPKSQVKTMLQHQKESATQCALPAAATNDLVATAGVPRRLLRISRWRTPFNARLRVTYERSSLIVQPGPKGFQERAHFRAKAVYAQDRRSNS